LVIISTTVAAFVLLLATAVHAMSTVVPAATDDYRVHAGDTLWSIASDATDAGGDVRSVVSEIRDLNGLATSDITVGDVLLVPAADRG
jgi:Tfp pilus assembly protein FimV